ncbi:protein kinase [Streptomyces sp. SCA3-4]|uniref:protein kinase n=1 Tax=Streptomyces sichuanensis TaxID=2871810 RepID=UPI001CE288A4|nr:protein kinase [Streptomyces sichuanensis]MCA6094741.1 protein kinase [Streptomyces sichuanensis]
MDEYAGRVLADRYRLPLPPSDAFELVETRAFDTYSGQEVLVRQIPLPEIVDAEVLADDTPGATAAGLGSGAGTGTGTAVMPGTRTPGAGPAAATGGTVPGAGAGAGAGRASAFGAVPGQRPASGAGAGAGSGLRERAGAGGRPGGVGRSGQGAGDPAVRRALAAATAAAQVPDHPRLDQVFHVFAEAGSLWIVSELVSARPLAALLAERTLSPHRAAEVAADVLTALRALHAQGWTHRNITVRTVLICDDGRAILTGLAAGAAEEALCGYDPVPAPPAPHGAADRPYTPGPADSGALPAPGPGSPGAGTPGGGYGDPGAAGGAYRDQGAAGGFVRPAAADSGRPGEARNAHGTRDVRAVRSGAIAAYHAAARAAAARAAAEAKPGLPTGASTWGGGSAASGTAPAPGARSAPSTPTAQPGGAPVPVQASGPRAPHPPAPVAEERTPAEGPAPAPARRADGWAYPGGPGSAVAAERARQARMVVVGAVTERWAPEQAWPIQENWQLAPPVGPAADLWALGALLFRVVQGHAPYPEDSTAELVQVVCAEPPAYAEECGALRPVVESLMRKDPTERPEFEELRGWLRSLIRSAPEPDIGSRTVTVPSIGSPAPADPRRLPVVRRRGELVRRRRARTASAAGPAPAAAHGRHKKTVKESGRAARPQERSGFHSTGHLQEQRVRTAPAPQRLGRLLLGLILLALIGAVLYALLFMPRAEENAGQSPADRTGSAGALSAAPNDPGSNGRVGQTSATGAQNERTEERGGAKEFTTRKDPKGFAIAVAKDWHRRGENDRGQVVYVGGDYELIVVPGRDKASEFGDDPMAYQQDKEPELAPYRSSSWSGASGLRRTGVGGTATAEGTFNWNDSSGRQVYVRNAAMLLGGRYHLVQVRGPMDEQRSIDGFFEKAMATYRAND